MIRLPPSLTFLERDWLSSNHLLARGPDGCVLVDTGYCTRRDMTLALVGQALGGAPLTRIVNTHAHSDHVGGNAALKALHRCRISVPAGIRAAIDRWDDERLMYATLGQACDRFEADDDYADGDTLALGDLPWRAVGAPGHDMDALLLYQPDHRLLMTADALWENGFGIVFPEFFGEPGFAAQAATLDRIAALDVAVVIPGHGPLFDDVAGALARARARLAHFRTRPERHALLGLRVAMQFMLLDRQRIGLGNLETTWGRLPLVERINARYFQRERSALTREVLASLLASGVARMQDGWLMPAASDGPS